MANNDRPWESLLDGVATVFNRMRTLSGLVAVAFLVFALILAITNKPDLALAVLIAGLVQLFNAVFLAENVTRWSTEMISRSSDTLEEAVAFERSKQYQFLPARTYKGQWSEAFNGDLDNSIERTEKYLYCGVTARYVALRIIELQPQKLHEVVVIIDDPSSAASLWWRVRRDRRLNDPDLTDSERESKLYAESMMGLAGLFEAHKYVDRLRITVVSVPKSFRSEVTDNALFLTVVPEEVSVEFPESYRFDKSVPPYDLHKRQIEHYSSALRERANPRTIDLDYSTQEDEYVQWVRATFPPPSGSPRFDLGDSLKEFEAFQSEKKEQKEA